MSVITYIGLNFEVEVTDDFTDDPVQFTDLSGSEENESALKENHFSTPFVYQLWDTEYLIWEMTEYNKQYSPHNFEKAKETFVQLCEFLNELIPDGDYCEIFICWLDDESEPMEHQVFIDLKNPVVEPLEDYEKCYIKFYK